MALQTVQADTSVSAIHIVIVLWLLFYIGRAIYRVWFHPLAKFPGPRLAAASHLYEAYYELIHRGGCRFPPKIRELHSVYGPIVRISPDEISVNDAHFHDKLYAPQPAIRDRQPNFSSFLGTTKGSFSTPDHQLHKSRRTAYSPFFSSSNVMASESVVLPKLRHLCDIISSRRDPEPKFRSYFAALGFDYFYTWAFGNSLDLLDNLSLAERCNGTVERLVISPPIYRIFPNALNLARKIPRSILRRVSHHLETVFTLEESIVKSAEQFVASQPTNLEKPLPSKKSGPETLFSAILRSNAPDVERTAHRMAQEGLEMFMASFTPGRTMTMGMWYLLSHPEILRKLRAELDYANPDFSQNLSYRQLNALPYMRAVMKEILRITFPVGTRLPMVCHEPMEFGSWIIPPYYAISVNHRSLMLDPDIFPEPDKFRPERWLDDKHPIDEKTHYVAFGKGGRSCPGKEFATNAIQLTIATLLQRFDFSIVDTTWERDVAVSRESTLTGVSTESNGGIKFKLVGARVPGQS